MQMLETATVAIADMTTSNIPENEHPLWAAGTTYALGDKANLSHRTYESMQPGNVGNDPAIDDGTWWLDLGASNRWRAFDLKQSSIASWPAQITYSITARTRVSGVAFFNVNAQSIRIRIRDSANNIVYDSTRSMVELRTHVVDWFSYFFGGVAFDSGVVFLGLPGFPGHRLEFTIASDGGNAEVGQIVLGERHILGETLDNTVIGINDFSTKERDAFGNVTIVERAFVDETEFRFAMNTRNARWVKRTLVRSRAKPAVYFIDEGADEFGATVFGFYRDLSIPLSSGGVSIATLLIEGLI